MKELNYLRKSILNIWPNRLLEKLASHENRNLVDQNTNCNY
jgi:hypothetical protein